MNMNLNSPAVLQGTGRQALQLARVARSVRSTSRFACSAEVSLQQRATSCSVKLHAPSGSPSDGAWIASFDPKQIWANSNRFMD